MGSDKMAQMGDRLADLADQWKAVRLVATDMDGTLTQAGKFTPLLLRSLLALQQAGIAVVIVTGRSAGWVQGVVSYLPVRGAIAENGGLWLAGGDSLGDSPGNSLGDSKAEGDLDYLIPLGDHHRDQLAAAFRHLQAEFPQIRESADNRFRLTDWTFDVQGLSLDDLTQMGDRCRELGWGFTYSAVQCHIKPMGQEKAIALQQVIQRQFPGLAPEQVVTVGDSPNDESLFDGDRFPLSVGVANVRHYADRLRYQPAFITAAAEAEGFGELTQWLCERPLPEPES